MRDLEGTRSGWLTCGLGVFFVLLAIGLTAWDLSAHDWIWPLNFITLAAGFTNLYFGRREIEGAREHHQFMEQFRAEIARHGWLWS